MDTKQSQLDQFAIFVAPVMVWLEQGAPHIKVNKKEIGFNMDHVFQEADSEYDLPYNKDFDENSCGSVCCIAGAIGQFNYKNDMLKELFKESSHTGKAKDAIDESMYVLKQAFPLIVDELEMLFIPSQWNTDEHVIKPYSNITPKEALKTIKKFLKTGKVDWSHIVIEI